MEQKDGRPKAILVLGMDRSGTSLLAEIVHSWGAFGGAVADLTHGDSANRHGYFEHPGLQQFLVKLMSHVGGRFWHPTFVETIHQKVDDPGLREAAVNMVQRMERHGKTWFWKDPTLAVTLPFWQRLVPDPIYVIPVRHPYESAVSWQKYSLPPEFQTRISTIHAGLLRWYFALREALTGTAASGRKIFVHYEALQRDPVEQCRRLCAFLDRQAGLGEEGREERVARMARAVDPSLYRNRSSVPFLEMPQPLPEQKALYEILIRKIEDPDHPFDREGFPFLPLYAEYLDNVHTFGEFYRRLRPAGRAWPHGSGGA